MQLNKLYLGLGGGNMLQLANRSHSQMMSYLIETPEGKTVMIDAGHLCREDATYLYTLLKERNSTVDLWIMTHAHHDHYGALSWMLQNIKPFDLNISDIRFTFPDLDWIKSVENGTSYPSLVSFLQNLERHNIKPSKLYTNDFINCGGMSFEILNDGANYSKYNTINDTSAVIRAYFPKRDILFLGDLGQSAGEDLLSVCPVEKLRCDIVQMSHHGQSGVDLQFYKTVMPKVCLYTAPDWLWENDIGQGKGSGPWKTLETRKWMEELNAFVSCPAAFGDYLFV